MDLTGYKIRVEKLPLGLWVWSATDPHGNPVPRGLRFGSYMDRDHAEEHAVKACEDHASQPEEIDAEQLRQRLAQT